MTIMTRSVYILTILFLVLAIWKSQQKMYDRVRLYIDVTHYFDVNINVLYEQKEFEIDRSDISEMNFKVFRSRMRWRTNVRLQ